MVQAEPLAQAGTLGLFRTGDTVRLVRRWHRNISTALVFASGLLTAILVINGVVLPFVALQDPTMPMWAGFVPLPFAVGAGALCRWLMRVQRVQPDDPAVFTLDMASGAVRVRDQEATAEDVQTEVRWGLQTRVLIVMVQGQRHKLGGGHFFSGFPDDLEDALTRLLIEARA